ncbi:MAG: hypothetical protein ACD_11C00006G0012 [uncultured bacterium]|nr:MAG: hypothetical protein ACD_11C00006G0012 [uncultured bacterium]HBR71688.1 hypothetical protein [Candidatus Moranbacteria bacterium]
MFVKIKNFFLVCLMFFLITYFDTNLAKAADEKINPASDLIYLGTFKVPATDNLGGSMNKAGYALTYYPNGNSGQGSLFLTGNQQTGYVAEINIPAPIDSDNENDLNTATVLQNLGDVTGGQLYGDWQTGMRIWDLLYYQHQGVDRMYMAMNEWYTPETTLKTLGQCSLDISNPNPEGFWKIGDLAAGRTTNYLLEINSSFADSYLASRYIGVGRQRAQMSGSYGPTLYAIAPWESGNPLADETALNYTQLLYYDIDNMPDRYAHSDRVQGAAWINVGSKSAFVVSETKSFRTANREGGDEYYGNAIDDGCGGKGYHSEPYFANLVFYDTNDLADVAQGVKQSYQPQPYAFFNFLKEEIKPPEECKKNYSGGVAYDKINNKLYVVERNAWGSFDDKSVIHVFQVTDSGNPLDIIAPADPINLQFDSQENTLSWNASVDSNDVSYVIYRRRPVKISEYGTALLNEVKTDLMQWLQDMIDTGDVYAGGIYYHNSSDDSILYHDYPAYLSIETSWTDPNPVYGNEYKVQAMDENGNLSGLVSLNSPDLNSPIIVNSNPSGHLPFGTTQAIFSLTTNENATCKYSTNSGTNYNDMTNTFATTGTTTHSQAISDLQNGQSYRYYIRCQDENSNQNSSDYTISFSIQNLSITYNLSNFISAIDNWLQIGNETSDVNSDSVVNTRDLGIMMSSWGN